jgi:hypothetical protein
MAGDEMISRGAIWLMAATVSLAGEALAQAPPNAGGASRNELTQTRASLKPLSDVDLHHVDSVHVDSVPADAGHADLARASAGAPTARSERRLDRGNPLWAISIADLSATRERPLFSTSRRPKPVATAPAAFAPPVAAPAEPERPLITLVGTVLRGTENVAIFADPTGQTAIRLHVGGENAGWVVRSVGLRAAVLERNNEQVTLTLPAPNTQPFGSAPAPLSDATPTDQLAGGRKVYPHPEAPRPAIPNPAF